MRSRRDHDTGAPGPSRRELLERAARLAIALPALPAALAGSGAFAQSGPAGAPRRGGSVIMAISADPAASNPNITTGATDLTLGCLVYEGLTRLAADFSPEPSLAESWEVTPDGLRYTFKLVEASWQDGKPFTSADVKFTLEEVSAKYSAKFKAAAEAIKSIATPDPRTVEIELSRSYGPFLFSLSAYGGGAILPAHVFQGSNILQNPASLDKPMGTGPFVLAEWRRGDRIILKKNPNYWRKGQPYLDEVIIRIIPDGGSRVLALKAGEADFCYYYFFPPSRVAEAQADPRLQLREQSVPQDKLLIFNLRQPPFQDRRVREAILRATNREQIKKVIYHDLGKVMKNHMDSRLAWAHDPAVDLAAMYPFDVKAANALLDEAGFPRGSGGRRFDVRLSFDSTDVDFSRMSQVLASLWRQIGVNVVFQGAPRNVMLEQVFAKWEFDATLQAYSTAGDPALGVSRLYTSSTIERRPFLNVSGYSNPEIDKLFEEGASRPTTATRGEAYRKTAPILARDLPLMPLWETASFNVASAKLAGKWAYSTGYSHWEDVWLES
jgi:peptide/nickel transport system substrate-binding protein